VFNGKGVAQVLVIFCVLFCCSSCDVPLEMPFTKYNVAWSADPLAEYSRDFKGWYHTSPGGRLAVLHWQGSGQLGGQGTTIILCLDNAAQGFRTAYRLKKGLFVGTSLAKIAFVQALDNQSFSCEMLGHSSMRVCYESRVPVVPKRDPVSEAWYLRFSVVTHEDERRVSKVLRQLYPQLKEREEAPEAVTFIEPFRAGGD